MTVNWKAALNPRSTTTEIYGADSWQGRHAAKLAAQKIAKADAALGLSFTEDALVRTDTGESVPLATVTAVTVDTEPYRLGAGTVLGAVLIGPIALLGRRGTAYLNVITTGPVWALPIARKRTGEARDLAARILTAAHAAH